MSTSPADISANISRVTQSVPDARATASFGFRFAIGSAHPALPGHFPGRPIVPGVLLLHHVLTGVTTALQRRVSVLHHVKFAAVLLPDETAVVACEAAGDRLRFSVQTRRPDALVTLATGSLQLAHGSVGSAVLANGSLPT